MTVDKDSAAAIPDTVPAADGPGRTTHLFLVLCAAAVSAFGAWSWFGQLDIVSVASGEVMPSSRVKSIQHLEGGIVRKVLVRDGQAVKTGQVLVELEATRSGADVGELTVRLNALRAAVARLEAEAANARRPTFPDGFARRHPGLARQATDLFRARRNRLAAEKNSQKEAVSQRRHDIKEIRARLLNARNGLKLINEQIAISEELLKEQLTNRYNHLDLLRERSSLKSRVEEDAAGLRGASAALKEAQARSKQIETAYQENVGTALEATRRERDELTQRMRKLEDNLRRTVLRAPVDGVVKQLHVFTVGGVVKAGEPVIDLVPSDDRLIIEAALPTHDIGYVRVGQPATIKLNSPDLARFGNIAGTVAQISPDTLLTDDGMPYYKVRVETGQDHFEKGGLRYELFPGMQVIASIQTGQRRVFEYILDPFLGSMDEALRER